MIPETQTIVDMPGLPADYRLRLEEAAGGAAASASGSTDIGVAAAGTTALDVKADDVVELVDTAASQVGTCITVQLLLTA